MTDRDEKDADFGALLKEYEKAGGFAPKRRGPQVGDAVKGRIVSIGKEAVLVDLGLKSEGIIDAAEVQGEDGKPAVKVGDEIEARVAQIDGKAGSLVLRYRMGRGPVGRDELSEAFENHVPVQGTVTGVNKGGVEVQVAGVRAFCPISQLDLRHVADAAAFVGLKLTFHITKYEPGPRGKNPNIVLNRRVIVEEEARAKAAEARARLQPGVVVKGKVTALKDYGAFVDLGGLEGMLHVSEIGFARVTRAADVLAVGQEVEVQILRIEKSDDPRRSERISLSLKSLAKDPWEEVPARFAVGARATGRIVRVESYGAFVELAPAIEGLLHVSALAPGKNVRHAREVAKVGDAVEVVVRELDVERRRISLEQADLEEEVGRAYVASRGGTVVEDGKHDTLGDLLRAKR
ncbi:MAG: S1 RNA-binding domain-containing protein [Deltaproteobacteria bacterium]|nr:S1 RNA-binding domain-containing protein [Deltaproteobacteria bacterium]